MPILDTYARPLASLRLSVTDRCNLRCRYCMPAGRVRWLPRSEILRFDEITKTLDALVHLGVRRLRLTGGEPLVRKGLPTLVAQLAERPLDDLALTTNGLLLAQAAAPLRAAGLGRVTVSLDTLDRARFEAITGRDELGRVLAGIDAALDAGLLPVKTDTVVIRGTNDHEIAALLEYAWSRGVEPRFIEYMPIGLRHRWRPDDAFGAQQILEAVARRFGEATRLEHDERRPAQLYVLEDGRRFGIVAANSAPFCHSCDRVRLTAHGVLYRCLHARQGLDLKAPLRQGAASSALAALIAPWWTRRESRGAEQRAGRGEKPEVDVGHDEEHAPAMHVRGG